MVNKEGHHIQGPEQVRLFRSPHHAYLMAAARLEAIVTNWFQRCYSLFSPAAYLEICSTKEHIGEKTPPWGVGDPEGEKRSNFLKGCKQSKGMLEGYLQVAWTRQFLFYLSFVTVSANFLLEKILVLKTITMGRELEHRIVQNFQYKVGGIEAHYPIAS